MKIVLLVVGKSSVSHWNDALNAYRERLLHYIPFELVVIPDVKNVKNKTEAQQKNLEGVAILKVLQPNDCSVLLDERGAEFSSVQFAFWLEKKINSSPKRLVFIAGGPYGLSDEVYQTVPERIALSKMTFSHQMVRPIFVEQLYRAMTILRNEPYHHQ
ncbi:MAG: 23S rRNA (pseudouridine(1915)-N(3))-methyltransferase RlmH [Tannerella sp.]|jgi:23S rRNA (pseudouridine1915-N3)-methyltransferase|nr:23S rRNA (pseudouridine(1915)-N(3))-methyltransferase RlmH [Tannerella sp.]